MIVLTLGWGTNCASDLDHANGKPEDTRDGNSQDESGGYPPTTLPGVRADGDGGDWCEYREEEWDQFELCRWAQQSHALVWGRITSVRWAYEPMYAHEIETPQEWFTIDPEDCTTSLLPALAISIEVDRVLRGPEMEEATVFVGNSFLGAWNDIAERATRMGEEVIWTGYMEGEGPFAPGTMIGFHMWHVESEGFWSFFPATSLMFTATSNTYEKLLFMPIQCMHAPPEFDDISLDQLQREIKQCPAPDPEWLGPDHNVSTMERTMGTYAPMCTTAFY